MHQLHKKFLTYKILIFRSFQTPSYGRGNSFWTPTTPTPSHALRPSLSLHNLESKTFTEVLIPTIRPPEKHEVSPQEVSPRSPRVVKFSPTLHDGPPQRSFSMSERHEISRPMTHPRNPTVPTIISPPGCTFRTFNIKTIKSRPASSSKSPPIKPPSPAQNYKSFTPIKRLTEISENVIFMECS